MIPADALQAKDWDAVTALARKAAALLAMARHICDWRSGSGGQRFR